MRTLPKCNGWCEYKNPVTHIGSSGYVYCASCAVQRRQGGYERTRQMRVWELDLIASGKQLLSYRPLPRTTCSECGQRMENDMFKSATMCSSCIHDARRSG